MTLRQTLLVVPLSLCLVFAISCANKSAAPGGPHATVTLRDGSTYSGIVTRSSPSEITLEGDDKSTRTIAMKDVRAVDYGDANTAAEPAPEAGAPAAGAPAGAPARAAARRPAPSHAAPPAERVHPAETSIQTKSYELPVGTSIPIRTDETIDSGKAVEGQTFAAEISKDVTDSSGAVVIPRGSNAQVVIVSASKGGRFRGASDLALDLQSVSVDGRRYELDTTGVSQKGHEGVGLNKRTGKFAGGGALLGTVIGAIAGGGKGAAIGAAAGAGAGVATQVITKGGAIRVPAETLLTFQLDKPLRVFPAK